MLGLAERTGRGTLPGLGDAFWYRFLQTIQMVLTFPPALERITRSLLILSASCHSDFPSLLWANCLQLLQTHQMLDVTATDAVPWYQGCCKSKYPQRCQGEPMACSAESQYLSGSALSTDDDGLATGDP